MSKDLYIAEYDRIYSKLIDGGCPEHIADELASEKAYPAMRERLADIADSARLRAKESK